MAEVREAVERRDWRDFRAVQVFLDAAERYGALGHIDHGFREEVQSEPHLVEDYRQKLSVSSASRSLYGMRLPVMHVKAIDGVRAC